MIQLKTAGFHRILRFFIAVNYVRTLKLPSSVHEEGVGEVSLFADAKLHGYRQNSYS
jgi:hypothetical protein